MRLMRTRAFAGTKEERTAFQAARQSTRREVMLKRMNPQQRETALKQESAAKGAEAATTKRAADDKTLRTKGITGTKEEREAFRKEKSGLLRERALERMTPEEREAALKQESAAHAAATARAEAKRKDKIRRTVAIVGDKAEREDFRKERQEVRRDDMLERMTPEQQQAALKQEADFKAAEAAKQQQEEAAKAGRTVAIVGDKAEREAFRASRSAPRGTPTVKETPGLALSSSRLTHEISELEKEVALLA